MRKAARTFLAFDSAVLLFGYALIGFLASWFLLTSAPIKISSILNVTRIIPEIGNAYIYPATIPKTPYSFRDDIIANSKIYLRENTLSLGPAFAIHNDIRDTGSGKYSISGRAVYFSTSDNSSPILNGRTYVLHGSVVPSGRWLIGGGAALLAWIALAFALPRGAARRAVPPLFGAGGAVFLAGVATGFLPILGGISLDMQSLASLPFLLLPLGLALLIESLLLNALPDPARSLPTRAAVVAMLAIAIFMALGTSGLLQGSHHAAPSNVTQMKPNLYEYRVQSLPLGMTLARDEERTLVNRTLISDQAGPLIPGQPTTRIETGPGGLSSFWYRTAVVSFRNPGGPLEPSNALTLTGALRIGPNTFGALLGLMILAATSIGLQTQSASPALTSTAISQARSSRRALVAGGVLTIASIALIYVQSLTISGPTTNIGFAEQLRITHLLAIGAAALALALLPWRSTSFQSLQNPIPPQVAIVLIALIAPLLGLLDAWIAASRFNSVSMTSLHMLGSMQSSDSLSYLHGALQLIATGVLNEWNSRRPLTGTLLTLRLLAGGQDMTQIMLLGALLISAGLTLAAREVLLVFGGWATFAFVIACAAFAAEWTPTTLSEGPGLAMGLFGLAALMAAWRRDSLLLFGLGVTVLSIGLMARAGPLFIVPAVVLAGPAIQWSAGRHRMVAWLLVGVAGAALGLSHSAYLVKMLGGSSQMIQSNFSYTLYGLAVGGKGWTQIFTDHPELFSGPLSDAPASQIYALAIEAIRAQPLVFIRALAEEFRRVPDFFYGYFDIASVNFWFVSGMVVAIISFPNRWAILGLAGIVGLYTSSPLIMKDGGVRVYAASVPLMGMLVVFGFNAFRWGIASLMAGSPPGQLWAAIRVPAFVAPTGRHSAFREPAALGAMAVLFLILVAPFAIGAAVTAPAKSIAAGPACEAGQSRLILHRRAMVDLFRIKPDGEGEHSITPNVTRSDLQQAAKIHSPGLAQALELLPTRYTLRAAMRIHRLDAPRSVDMVLVGWPTTLALDTHQPYLATCGVKVGDADSDVVGLLEVYEIRSASPVGFASQQTRIRLGSSN